MMDSPTQQYHLCNFDFDDFVHNRFCETMAFDLRTPGLQRWGARQAPNSQKKMGDHFCSLEPWPFMYGYV